MHHSTLGSLDDWAARLLLVLVLAVTRISTGAFAAELATPVSPGGAGEPTVVEARCPTFSWAGAPAASGYELAVYAVPAAASVEPELLLRVELPADSRSFTPPVGRCLERGGRYAWSVAAEGAAEWSSPLVFEVEADSATEPVPSVEQAVAVLERYLRENREARDDATSRDPAETSSSISAAGSSSRFGSERDNRSELDQDAHAIVRVASAASPAIGAASLAVSSQIHLGSSSALFKGGGLFLWDDNTAGNTALGREALQSVTTGTGNTAVGRDALRSTSGGTSAGGSFNTAVGDEALLDNETGKRNTGIGSDALRENTTGYGNTAVGANAMLNNTLGHHNVAAGAYALRANTTGRFNTAVGVYALRATTSGRRNVAIGTNALAEETGGYSNTAIGFQAMEEGTDHLSSTAVGAYALRSSTSDFNTAVGELALVDTTTGSDNVALGYAAGRNNVTGSNNVFIAHRGISPVGGGEVDNDTIRIGRTSHDRFFAGGVRGKTTGENDAIPVLIDSEGQLGTASSSRRTKQDIQDASGFADRLLALRPVAFRYRQHAAANPSTPLQFGLIAEEVAEVLPELVVFDEQGRPETIKYHLLSSLLLAGLEAQHGELSALRERVRALEGAAAAAGRGAGRAPGDARPARAANR